MTLSPAMTFFWAGVALILIELAVLQFSVVWLLLAGLASLAGAAALLIFPDGGWALGLGTFFFALIGLTVGLYRPLMKWQNQPGAEKGDTALGQRAKVLEAISIDEGKVAWSGTEWQARLSNPEDETIESGSVEIVKFEGITVWVKAV